MSGKLTKTCAATAITLSLGAVGAPLAAAAPAPLTPAGHEKGHHESGSASGSGGSSGGHGSAALCFHLGSAFWCI